jgi:preprotein translocase subunit SecF
VLFGIVVGTSSSMFIAAPMAMFLERRFSPEGPAAREPASLESESGYL